MSEPMSDERWERACVFWTGLEDDPELAWVLGTEAFQLFQEFVAEAKRLRAALADAEAEIEHLRRLFVINSGYKP